VLFVRSCLTGGGERDILSELLCDGANHGWD